MNGYHTSCSKWIYKTVKATEAKYILCKRAFYISRMGVCALNSHAAASKHENKMFEKSSAIDIRFLIIKETLTHNIPV